VGEFDDDDDEDDDDDNDDDDDDDDDDEGIKLTFCYSMFVAIAGQAHGFIGLVELDN
jgi:hypothetical protein